MKCFVALASLMVAGARAEAGAEAEANTPAPYGYTPAPPAYGYSPSPAPYVHPEPVYAPYVPEPAPYHPEPAPYVPHPEPTYGPHHPTVHPVAPVHHVPVHHAPVHHAPVHHAPAPYAPAPPPHHPEPHHYAPPKCSKGNPKTWCLEDEEYPTYEIQKAIEYHYDSVQQMYKDVLANTDNSVARLKEIVQETYLCPSETAYIQPKRAVNIHGKWRIVVNQVKAHYETLTQTARIEECTTAGESCPLVPECYETKCLQKNIYHRFLVYDPYDHYLPFAIESFKLPSACACYNGAYAEPPHK